MSGPGVPPAVPVGAPGPSASRTVLGRGSLYTIATAGPALAAVAVIPAVTRVLPGPEYDVVALATAVIQVGFVLAALGLGAAITRQYVLDQAGAPGARGLVLQGGLLAVVVGVLAAATVTAWSPLVLGRPASVEIVLALVACVGGAAMVLSQAYLRGADRALTFVALAVVASLAGPVAGLLAVVALERTATAYLTGVAAGFVLAGAAGLVLVLRSGPRVAGRRGLGAALRIGLPTVPHQVSLYLALAGLVVVAGRLLDESGRASVALTVGAGATVVTAGLNNAWAPVVYRTAEERRGAVLTETSRVIALVAVGIAGTVALLSPWVLRILVPPSYAPDGLVPAVALAAAAAVPSVVYLASGHLVFAAGRTAGLALTTPLAVAAGLLSAVVLAPRWGVTAVGAGYLLTYGLLAALTTALQRRVATRPWRPPLMPAVTVLWAATTAAGALLGAGGAGAVARLALAVALLAAVAGLLLAARRPSAKPV